MTNTSQRLKKEHPTWDDTLLKGMGSFESAANVKYLCRTCREYKYPNYFSIDGVRRDESGHLKELQCNECKLAKTPDLFLRSDAPFKWQTQAACADEPVDTFFPENVEKLREQRWQPICAECPVRAECEAYGRQTRSYGVWGGVLLYAGLEGSTSTQIENLLNRGKCRNGHEIKSRDDLIIRTNTVTGYHSGECRKCDAVRRADQKEKRREKSVMLVA